MKRIRKVFFLKNDIGEKNYFRKIFKKIKLTLEKVTIFQRALCMSISNI